MLDEEPGTTAHKLACGYRGLVVEQFSYEEALNTAVDSVAGNRYVRVSYRVARAQFNKVFQVV